MAKRNILDCEKFISWMNNPKAYKDFRLTFLIIVTDLKLVVHLLIVDYFLNEYIFLVEYFDRISSLIPDDVMRNKS
jgi:hypothetical protein